MLTYMLILIVIWVLFLAIENSFPYKSSKLTLLGSGEIFVIPAYSKTLAALMLMIDLVTLITDKVTESTGETDNMLLFE